MHQIPNPALINALGNQKDPEKLFMGIREIVKTLGIPLSTLRRWERNGVMPKAVRFVPNGPRFWQINAINEWISQLNMPNSTKEEVHQALDFK